MSILTYYDLTPDVLEEYINVHNRIIEFGKEYYNVKQGYYPDVVTITDINPREVRFFFERTCYDRYETLGCEYMVPFSLLTDVDWIDKLRQQLLEENIRAIEARKEAERKRKEEQRQARFDMYEKLRKEFE